MPYLLYKLVPGENDRTEKLPVSPHTGKVVSAHEPEHWVPRAQAELVVALWGKPYGVAYVLPPERTHWAIDIDGAYNGGEWSATATELCQRFAGCYVEISQSGRGLHIIGKGSLPPHSVKSKTLLGVDLFSHRRFIALTGNAAAGDMDAETPEILALAAEHFPPRADGGGQADHTGWTDTPCEEWSGPTDDDELLQLAMTRQSPGARFGAVAPFPALWTADETVLGKFFPDTEGNQNRAYDASKADAALARHLAFWTGRDCERIRRLMERSALVRSKWLREDYIYRTVLGVCAITRDVYAKGAVTIAYPTGGAPSDDESAPPERFRLGQIIGANDYVKHFAGCVWIEGLERVAAPDGTLLTKQQFDANSRYGGHNFVIDETGKTTRSAWDAFGHNPFWHHPRADGICFRPELPSRSAVYISDKVLYNTYVPIKTLAIPGDVSPMLDHIAKMIPNERDRQILISWHAAQVQYPGVKFQWALVVQGCEGNGKSLLSEALRFCVGSNHCHMVAANDLANKFNGWVTGKLLAVVEELAVRDRVDMTDVLKVLITNREIEIQRKGENQYTGDNRANILINTNHKDALPKSLGDRRYGIFFCEQQEAVHLVRDGMGGEYFPNLYRWARDENGFAFWNHYLRSYQIPDEFNPATLCHRAPFTSSTTEAIAASRGPAEQAIAEAIESEDVGFSGGFISSHWLGIMLEARKLRGRAPQNKWDAIMASLGYIRHPHLVEGRTNNKVLPDGRRPRLWVKPGSRVAAMTRPGDISAAYTKSNNGL